MVLSRNYPKMSLIVGRVFVFIQSVSRCEMSWFMFIFDEQISSEISLQEHRARTIDSNNRNKNLIGIKMLFITVSVGRF